MKGTKERTWKINLKDKKVLGFIAVAVVVLIAGIAILLSLPTDESEFTTVSKAALEKVLEIEQLSTVEYTYNAIATVYDDEGKKIKYYVAYEGSVAAGIRFNEIEIEINKKDKVVDIIVPEIQINDIDVNMGTMEYIFTDAKYETENITQEAYKKSIQNLQERVDNETTLKEMVKENTISSIKALYEPWVKQIDEDYTVNVR